MKKNIIFLIISLLMLAPPVLAHCPLCTAAVGVGIGVTRVYGVDDSIVGLFLGAFIVSSALWFNKWIKKKIEIPIQKFLVIFAFFLLTILPLYFSGVIVDPQTAISLGNSIFGVDKLLFGTIIGILASWLAFEFSDYIKKIRKKVLWPYQSISFIAITLIILSLILWSVI